MIVKVQVPQGAIGGHGRDPSAREPLLIYNQSRSYYQMLQPTHPQYARVKARVRADGILKAKAYMYARLGASDAITINVEKLAPMQDW